MAPIRHPARSSHRRDRLAIMAASRLLVLSVLTMISQTARAGSVEWGDIASHGKTLVASGVDEDDRDHVIIAAGSPFALHAQVLDGLRPWPTVAAGSAGLLVASPGTSAAFTSTDGKTWTASPALPAKVLQVVAWKDQFIASRPDGCELFVLRPAGWEAIGRPDPGLGSHCSGLLADGARLVLGSHSGSYESTDLVHWTRWGHFGIQRATAVDEAGSRVVRSFCDDECSPSPASVSWTHDGTTWQTALLSDRRNYATTGACQKRRCVVATSEGFCFENGASFTCRKSGVRSVAKFNRGFVGAGRGLFISADGRSFSPLFVPKAKLE